MSRKNRPVTKDMYWFAHGGAETLSDKNQKGDGDENDFNSFEGKINMEHKGINEDYKRSYSRDISLTDGSNSSGPPSLERDDRLHATDKRAAVEERRKLLWEAEQERNEAMMKKHMEREAALEAKRNAQRSTISFAFGSSIPRNVDALQIHCGSDMDSMSRSFTAGGSSHRTENHTNLLERRSMSPFNYSSQFPLDNVNHFTAPSFSSHSEIKTKSQTGCLMGSGALIIGEDLMSRSMIAASSSAPRGRRKNDLMPTVPYDRTAAPRVATSSSSRRRSVSMTRLDQLAQPRRHYLDATKALSTTGSGMVKDGCSPNRPLSSASEHSGGKTPNTVTRRIRSSPRKPRPISIAGTIPDQKQISAAKSLEVKAAPLRRTPVRKTDALDVKKASTPKNTTPSSSERTKANARPSTAPAKSTTPKSTTPKQPLATKPMPKAKKVDSKSVNLKAAGVSANNSTPKAQGSKLSATNKKKNDLQVSPEPTKEKSDREEKSCSPTPDSDGAAESDKNGKRIISEEEAKAALAEKRRLAREQAEKEAELERQRQEDLKRLEEERLQKEEEEQRRLEEEHLRLIEEHRRQEEEKLRKAIEDQEQKEEEERVKRDEEMRLKAEQERKAKEEAEKLRLELEEKLRKEEEERAERKKRLEKIMSRTRGKSSGTSPSGSISGSDQLDSGENQQEGFSSGATSLESNDGKEPPCESASSDDMMAKMEVSSGGNSAEANLTYELDSNDVSLNSNDLMLPTSETASQNNSMVILSEKETLCDESTQASDPASPLSPDDKLEPLEKEAVVESKVFSEVQQEQESMFLGNEREEVILQSAEDHIESNVELESNQVSSENLADKSPDHTPLGFGNDITTDSEVESNLIAKLDEEPQADPNAPFESVSKEVEIILESDCQKPVQDSDLYSDLVTTVDNLSDTTTGDQFLENNKAHSNDLFDGQFTKSSDNPVDLEQKFLSTSEIISTQDTLMTTSMYGELSESAETQNSYFPNPFETSKGLSPEPPVFDNEAADDLIANVLENDEQDIRKSAENEDLKIEQDIPVNSEVADQEITSSSFQDEENASASNFEKSSFAAQDLEEHEVSHGDDAVVTNNDNQHSIFENDSEDVAIDSYKTNTYASEELSGGDNPFISNNILSKNGLNGFESGDCFSQEQNFSPFEQNTTEGQGFSTDSSCLQEKESVDNVTLIKEVGSENYVGIISSIDNDQLSNNFPKLHDQFTNNFECASTTDTEDSSLDSNLSQVAAVENGDQDFHVNLTNGGNSVLTTDTLNFSSNNIEQLDNPFQKDSVLNQTNIPQLSHFSSEVYSNGHGVESSKVTDGNGILDVAPSQNNIFQNVDTLDYSKVAPDPFLVKGSSISGNPFLAQDEQKQVLMSSDFLN